MFCDRCERGKDRRNRTRRCALGNKVVEPDDAFVQFLTEDEACGGELVLGLFPALRPEKTDMVTFDARGRVRLLGLEPKPKPKPKQRVRRYAREIAIWTPAFKRLMHDFVVRIARQRAMASGPLQAGAQISAVVQAAIDAGLAVEAVIFENGRCLDIGTPEDLLRAVRWQVSDVLPEW